MRPRAGFEHHRGQSQLLDRRSGRVPLTGQFHQGRGYDTRSRWSGVLIAVLQPGGSAAPENSTPTVGRRMTSPFDVSLTYAPELRVPALNCAVVVSPEVSAPGGGGIVVVKVAALAGAVAELPAASADVTR